MDPAHPNNRVCLFCMATKPRDDFSKNQRGKGALNKCKICVGRNKVVPKIVQIETRARMQREREARDRLAWEEASERQRQLQRARALEDERRQLEQREAEQRREEQRALAKALVQPMLRANASMMATSSFWSSTHMITHALAFLPAADVLACSVRSSKHLADVLKGKASVAAMWEGSLKRDFPARELIPAQLIHLYRAYYMSRNSCNRCDGVFVDSRLTKCEFCEGYLCDALRVHV
jgi:hypothetical protein